ncbi:MAG: hypothetical protein QOJ08_2506, partial [Ilumatobacteraceae bacterium]
MSSTIEGGADLGKETIAISAP